MTTTHYSVVERSPEYLERNRKDARLSGSTPLTYCLSLSTISCAHQAVTPMGASHSRSPTRLVPFCVN